MPNGVVGFPSSCGGFHIMISVGESSRSLEGEGIGKCHAPLRRGPSPASLGGSAREREIVSHKGGRGDGGPLVLTKRSDWKNLQNHGGGRKERKSKGVKKVRGPSRGQR
jgi:hypothetical protein